MLRIMVGHGNCRNSGLKLPYCQGQPAAGIHVDNMPSDPKEKAKVPLQKKKKRKKKKEKKKKGLCTVPYIFPYFFKNKKQVQFTTS